MRRIPLILILLLAWSGWSASPTPATAFIETNGCFMQVYINTASIPVVGSYTNGDGGFLWGIASNSFAYPSQRYLVNPYVVLALTSPGFDSTGASNAFGRTIRATRELRKPYPNWTNVDAVANGSGIIVRVALENPVFSTDISLTNTIAAGWFSNSVAATFSVTNSSLLTYTSAKVIGNWLEPDFQVIGQNSYTLKWRGAGWFHRGGKSLACVIGKAHDSHGHTNTVTVSTLTRNIIPVSGLCSPDYFLNFDASGFTDGDTITNDVRAVPLYGDTTSILDTYVGLGYTNGSPFPHSLAFVLNKAGAYSKARCVVDFINGVDANGVVIKTNLDTANPPASFLTVSGAWTASKGTNNSTSSGANNTAGGAIIYLLNDGALTVPANDTMLGYVTITTYPTNLHPASVTNGPASSRRGMAICFTNVVMDHIPSTAIFGYKAVWCDHDVINVASSTKSWLDDTVIYFTQCTVSNNDQAFAAAGAGLQPVHLAYGNRIYTMGNNGYNCHTVVGNYDSNTNQAPSAYMKTLIAGQLYEPDWTVVCDNAFPNVNCASGSTWGFFGQSEWLANGCLVEQNLMVQTGGVGPMLGFHSDSSVTNITNCIIRGNTIVGFWNNLGYNEKSNFTFWVQLFQERGNIYTGRHSKSDTFNVDPEANRVGNWPVMFGVGLSDNLDFQNTSVSAAGDFVLDFEGVNSFQPPWIPTVNSYWSCQKGGNLYPQFVSDGSASNGTAGFSNGNYHLKTGSPGSEGWRSDPWLPWDLEGNTRGLSDPPGCYSSANPRKAGGFF